MSLPSTGLGYAKSGSPTLAKVDSGHYAVKPLHDEGVARMKKRQRKVARMLGGVFLKMSRKRKVGGDRCVQETSSCEPARRP